MRVKIPDVPLVSILVVTLLCASVALPTDAQAQKADASRFAATDCDPSMWTHVWSPKRLQQLAPCITVTGTVLESTSDEDGDQHFLLRLDPGQDGLVNKRNRKKKDGALVVEIVCANPTKQKKPRAVCAGYANSIPLPQSGWRVRVTGSYVIDTHNGWAELHPVSKLQKTQ